VNAVSADHMTPLACATWKGHLRTVEYLLEHGAQVSETDSSMRTVLHWAVDMDQYPVFLALLSVSFDNPVFQVSCIF
jgi:ankyrin repeat protein